MNNAPLISVIVPVYGVEDYLDRCVESIAGQTYQNLQIILVDDGSPDRCPAMCDAWAETDNRIRVIHKENGGLSDARNAGLAIADGEYVSFVDSDDWLDLRFLEILYRAAAENDCEIAECGYVATAGENPGLSEVGDTTVYTAEEAMELHLRDRRFRQVVWNKLYRRDVITLPFEKGKYHEDVFWTYRIIAECSRLAHVQAALYCYLQREDSIMGAVYSLKRLDAVEASARRCRFVTEHFPSLAGLAQEKLISTCMYHYQLLLKNSDVDPDHRYRKWICDQSRCAGNCWKKADQISNRQKMWMRLFIYAPKIAGKTRNALGIGF